MKKINVLSLFGGIEAGMEAITRMGMQDHIANYYSAEIDQYPAKMAKHNFPNVQHIGSVTEVKGDQFDRIDFLIGGPPCQDLSIAGKRAGLDGERSGLFYEFVRILNETKPEYFFMENVASMPKDAFETINACLGFEGVKRNASKVSAQNRRRLYWLGKRNDDGTYSRFDTPEPEDRGIMLRDVLEDIPLDDPRWKELDVKYIECVSGRICKFNKLTETGTYCLNPKIEGKQPSLADRIYHSEGKTTAVTTCYITNIIGEKSLAINANYSKESQANLKKSGHEILVADKSNCIPATYYKENVKSMMTREKFGIMVGLAHRNRGEGKNPECNKEEKSNAITSVQSDSEVLLIPEYVWRKLTVRECARLQGFRDEYDTSVLSDSRAYKGFGNSWQVDEVMEFWKHLPFFN